MPAAIVFISTADARSVDKGILLQQILGLTPTEAMCALILADGGSIDEAAEGLRVSRNTIRSHLRSLFQKTGTHRQGALVAALNRELAVFELLLNGSENDES